MTVSSIYKIRVYVRIEIYTNRLTAKSGVQLHFPPGSLFLLSTIRLYRSFLLTGDPGSFISDTISLLLHPTRLKCILPKTNLWRRNIRLTVVFFLLQYEKEFSYILDRLVRGIGTSRVDARKGFYSTLVALMVTYKSRIPSEKIIELMKKNLQTSGSCSKSVSFRL